MSIHQKKRLIIMISIIREHTIMYASVRDECLFRKVLMGFVQAKVRSQTQVP